MGLNVLVERQKGPVLVLHKSTEVQAEINSTTSVAAVTHLSIYFSPPFYSCSFAAGKVDACMDFDLD